MTRKSTGKEPTGAESALLAYIGREDYRPMPQRELMHRTHVAPEDRPAVRRLIRSLIDEGRIRKLRGGRLAPALPADGVRGVLHRHQEGHGLVVPESGGEDVFLAPGSQKRARSGDLVALEVTGRGEDGRLHGLVTRILERRTREVVGVYNERGRDGVVQPFDPTIGESIRIPAASRRDAKHMHAVLVQIVRPAASGQLAEGRVLERLGHLDEAGTDVMVVVQKYGLSTRFPDDVLIAAEALPSRVGPREAQRRERFDDPPPITIDGETAQDFDDAICVEQLADGGFRLYVHIADVAHFVPAGGVLDVEARHRGTSVYFPGRVLPMFPEALSNGLCSLRPGVDRLVQSVVIDLSEQGKIRRVRFADGVIHSAARLTYTQVAEVLDGKRRGHGVPGRLVPMLQTADRLREVLERKRHARGSIDFDLPEPQILLDVEGVMTGITIEPRNHAHRMIEEFMLVANEVVAEHLSQNGSSCAFRVHEPPDPEKLDTLRHFIERFGLRLGSGRGGIQPREIQQMIEQVEGRPEYPVISQVTLRSMKRARYSPDNSGHFGLASEAYCHFTSPIRRYPDLLVHRQLRELRGADSSAADSGDETMLRALCESASELERNAEAAERELLVWKKVAFVESKCGETFDGVVTGVARFGLFVQLIENLVEGLIHVESLGDEWFEFLDKRMELRGERSGTAYRLGDRLKVRVERVDRVLQRVDLALQDDRADRQGSRGRQKSKPGRHQRRRR